MARYAWGQAALQFPNCECPAGNSSNLLLIDGVEVRDVDFVDTKTLEYRVILRDEGGSFIVRGDDVLREMRKANKTLEITLEES